MALQCRAFALAARTVRCRPVPARPNGDAACRPVRRVACSSQDEDKEARRSGDPTILLAMGALVLAGAATVGYPLVEEPLEDFFYSLDALTGPAGLGPGGPRRAGCCGGDRAHRLGQTRDVEVFRYVSADTIEERMLLLQERKRELANAAFDRRSADENRQMRIDDVRLLMSL
ncbi:putative SWI/SNF-related matrix-associated actin-dependent regulator of chromatin [Tetrabaena socialis]|uniref:Putative SWI/SNF-related matrix-associated actin-dependent regulator of chromatin n=1 Tax=Tetrabaena socialis TaxID=47790 RepID=A0A2J7ZWW4_9CHLO|nr:putative SWI/SNF-related matrix-associated actin-dependent regulator of chromatin [Tetrabaena socialis]|eukprot:PNH04748.1 putative SWI/SNF-related matrix-associated actin-dependent regulator of chromatin [Tetrabaena socialis]